MTQLRPIASRRTLVFIAALAGAGCASIRVMPALSASQCVVDPSITGAWTDRRMTQLGPAWIKFTLGCDCSESSRVQLLFGRITQRRQYRASGGALHFETQRGPITSSPYRIEGDTLFITEAPGEIETYARQSQARCIAKRMP